MPFRMESEAMSPVDAALLHMEKPHSMAMITGIFIFDEPVDFERLKKVISERLLVFNRFRQRIRHFPVGLPRWETDPHFDLSYHIQRVGVREPGNQEALQELAGKLMSTALDYNRPLWQYHLVTNCKTGCAIIARLHHCIADGIALMYVLLSMCDLEPDAPWSMPELKRKPVWTPTSFFRPAIEAANTTMQVTESLAHEGMETLLHPFRLRDALSMGAAASIALNKLVMLGPDSQTILRGKLGIPKRVAWSKPIPLTDVKAVAEAMDGTINDVLTAAASGGVGRYLQSRGDKVRGVNIRAMVPVNLRPPEEMGELGNRFGLVILSLPVGIKDPIQRLQVIKQRMDDIKDSPEALVAFSILNVMGLTAIRIEDLFLKFFGMKVSTVLTNVPGPRQELYLAGKSIRTIMFWVPSPAERAMGISIFSYAGDVTVGINTDAGLVPDPEVMIACFHEDFEEMKFWAT
jgi:diacylglycerol O-acyltransferase